MFPNHYREDYLRSLAEERDRIVRRNHVLLELADSGAIARGADTTSQAQVGGRRTGQWDGRERRQATPCPEIKDAVTT
jgi:hypothetical protein